VKRELHLSDVAHEKRADKGLADARDWARGIRVCDPAQPRQWADALLNVLHHVVAAEALHVQEAVRRLEDAVEVVIRLEVVFEHARRQHHDDGD